MRPKPAASQNNPRYTIGTRLLSPANITLAATPDSIIRVGGENSPVAASESVNACASVNAVAMIAVSVSATLRLVAGCHLLPQRRTIAGRKRPPRNSM